MLKITHLKIKGFETVVVGKDPDARFHAIIAVHSTRLGPSLGGIRMWPYENEKEALRVNGSKLKEPPSLNPGLLECHV